jgi:hypothetical protein
MKCFSNTASIFRFRRFLITISWVVSFIAITVVESVTWAQDRSEDQPGFTPDAPQKAPSQPAAPLPQPLRLSPEPSVSTPASTPAPLPAAPLPQPLRLSPEPSVSTPASTPAPLPTTPPPQPSPTRPEPSVSTPAPQPAAEAKENASVQASTQTAVSGSVGFSSPQILKDNTKEEAISTDEMATWKRRYRRYNSLEGGTGGIRLIDARSGAPSSVRIQFGLDGFSTKDFLNKGDKVERIGQTLSVGWTPIEYMEVFGLIVNRSTVVNEPNPNADGGKPTPKYYNTQGNAQLGVKAGASVATALALGGDVGIFFPNQSGGVGVMASAISLDLRGAAEIDLRELEKPIPFIGRVNLDYLLDNSAMLVEGTENANYAKLSNPEPKDSETRNLITREARFGLGINRVDFLSIGLGVEVPLEVAEEFYLHPALEWNVSIPINRHDYVCSYDTTTATSENTTAKTGKFVRASDSCLVKEGSDSVPMVLTLGVRVVTPVRGLSGFLGADIGLAGVSTFVREIAPTPPYQLLFALSYDFDARPAQQPAPEKAQQPVALKK